MATTTLKNMVVENARLIFRNFAGKETKFNPAGRRNFCLIIDDPQFAEEKRMEGWNVKTLRPKDIDADPQSYIQVGVNYSYMPPKIYLIKGKSKTELDEESVACLDYAEIENVDLVIRPYHWDLGGKTGIKAYLKNMYVTVSEDELAKKYEYEEGEEDMPF